MIVKNIYLKNGYYSITTNDNKEYIIMKTKPINEQKNLWKSIFMLNAIGTNAYENVIEKGISLRDITKKEIKKLIKIYENTIFYKGKK